jgi:hypothetical protein
MRKYAALGRRTAVSVAVAAVLYSAVYLNLGTRWGYERHLNPYVVGLAGLPLGIAVVTRQRSLVVPAGLVALGVVLFTAGVFWNGALCRQTVGGSWGFVYDWGAHVIRFGPGGTLDGFACVARPNHAVAAAGYVLADGGVLYWLDTGAGGVGRTASGQ